MTQLAPRTAAATAEAFVAATRAGDLAAMTALTAPGVILKSPIMGGTFVLEGRGEVAQAFRIMVEDFDELAVGDLFAGGDTQILTFSGRARGEPFDAVQSMRIDAAGEIDHIALYVRPFVGLAQFARVVGPAFMRPHNRLWAAIASSYGWIVTCAIRLLVFLGGPMVKTSVRRIAAREGGR